MAYKKISGSQISSSSSVSINVPDYLKKEAPSDLPELSKDFIRCACFLFSVQQYDFKTESGIVRKGTSLKFINLDRPGSNLSKFIGFEVCKGSVPYEAYDEFNSENVIFPQLIFIDFNKEDRIDSIYY